MWRARVRCGVCVWVCVGVYGLVVELVVMEEACDDVGVGFVLEAPSEEGALACDEPPARLLAAAVRQAEDVVGQAVALRVLPQLVPLQQQLPVILLHRCTAPSSRSGDSALRPRVVDRLQHLQAVERRLLELRQSALARGRLVVEGEAGGGEEGGHAGLIPHTQRHMAMSAPHVALHGGGRSGERSGERRWKEKRRVEVQEERG